MVLSRPLKEDRRALLLLLNSLLLRVIFFICKCELTNGEYSFNMRNVLDISQHSPDKL